VYIKNVLVPGDEKIDNPMVHVLVKPERSPVSMESGVDILRLYYPSD